MSNQIKSATAASFDIAVVGGGLSGVCAAASAAAAGRTVLLVEKYGFLGGMTTAAFFTPWELQGTFQECGRIGGEILASLETVGGIRIRGGRTAVDLELLKFILQELLLRHNVKVLLHSQCCGIEKNDSSILFLDLQCREGKNSVAAKRFIDATGAAALAGWTGVSVRHDSAVPSYRFMMTGVRDGEISEERVRRFADQWSEMHPHVAKGTWDIAPAIREGEAVVGIRYGEETGADARRLIETRMPQLVAEAESFLRSELDEFRSASVLAVPAQMGLHSVRTVSPQLHVLKRPGIDEISAGDYDRAMRIAGIQNLYLTGRNIIDPQMLSATNNPQASMLLGERTGVLAAQSLS